MKKTIVTLTTVAVVGISSAFLTQPIHAETLDEIKDQRVEIKQNLSKAEAEIADLLIDLEELNHEIDRNETAFKENEKQMDSVTEELILTEEEILELETAIEKRSEILKQRAVSYQKNGGNIGFLDVIFGATTFTDFISRVTAVTKITESDRDLLDQIESDKSEVEKKQIELEEMKIELEGIQALIIDQKEQNETKREELKKKEKDLQAKVDELKIKDSKLATLESQVRRSITARSIPAVKSNQVTSNINSLKTLGKKSTVASNPSGNVNTAINAGYTVLGTPYVWAGKGPGGFDCSGFVSWAYGQGGYHLPSSTSQLSRTGTKVSYNSIQPGDLVFFNTYKTNGHVGIYIGGGKFIGAQNKTGVAVADMTSGYWKDHFKGHVRRVN